MTKPLTRLKRTTSRIRKIVVAREDGEGFDVSPEEEAALLAAIAEADRGELVSWKELREQLRRFG